jgi:hypothetical protein
VAAASSFVGFVSRLGMVLTPGQAALCRVAFDGVQPSTLKGDERAAAEHIFGGLVTVPEAARRTICLVKGRGIGGSRLCSYRLLHLALTVPLTLAPGEVAAAIIQAPTLRTAKQTLRFVLGIVDKSPGLFEVLERNTEAITIRRPDGYPVSIEARPAAVGGLGVRGVTIVGAILEETAHFRDPDTGVVNDGDCYAAVTPRLVKGGQILLPSSPWAESGLLWQLFQANHGRPDKALACHCPTLLMRPDPQTLADHEAEMARDPDAAARELLALFMTTGASSWFDRNAVARSRDPELLLGTRADPASLIGAGADFAFRSDSSALCVVEKTPAGRYRVRLLEELRPQRGAPLKPSAVVERFADLVKPYGVDSVSADGFYRESISEHLNAAKLGLDDLPGGQTGKVAQYTLARSLLHEGRVDLPDRGAERLCRQLSEIASKPTTGGGLTIMAPRRDGHGDQVSAFVAGLWAASHKTTNYLPAPSGARRTWGGF